MKNYKIKFVSGDLALVFDNDSVCRILTGGLEGFDSPELDVSIQSSGFFDGGFAYQKRICPRNMSIKFEVSDRSYNEAVRDVIIKMMNPHNECEIISDFSGRLRKISVVPCDTPEFILNNFNDYLCVKLSFIAPYPFFCDVYKTRLSFSDAVPLLSFPLNLMNGAGTVCGMKKTGNTAATHKTVSTNKLN